MMPTLWSMDLTSFLKKAGNWAWHTSILTPTGLSARNGASETPCVVADGNCSGRAGVRCAWIWRLEMTNYCAAFGKQHDTKFDVLNSKGLRSGSRRTKKTFRIFLSIYFEMARKKNFLPDEESH